jgi:hypothetical protein
LFLFKGVFELSKGLRDSGTFESVIANAKREIEETQGLIGAEVFI